MLVAETKRIMGNGNDGVGRGWVERTGDDWNGMSILRVSACVRACESVVSRDERKDDNKSEGGPKIPTDKTAGESI